MASSSKSRKGKEGLEIQLVSNEVKQHEFKPILEVAYKNDLTGALSVILDKVVMVQDVRNAFEKLCVDEKLKDEIVIIEKKTLTKALAFPTVFKTEWIRIVLSRIHDGAFWLETGPVKLTKKIISRVSGFQTLDRPKTLRSDKREAIEKKHWCKVEQ